jgi:hypothetical protein
MGLPRFAKVLQEEMAQLQSLPRGLGQIEEASAELLELMPGREWAWGWAWGLV